MKLCADTEVMSFGLFVEACAHTDVGVGRWPIGVVMSFGLFAEACAHTDVGVGRWPIGVY